MSVHNETPSFKIVNRLTTLFPSAMLEEHAEDPVSIDHCFAHLCVKFYQ